VIEKLQISDYKIENCKLEIEGLGCLPEREVYVNC
jgi:hypothetical protein